jgi:hypothetical protein
MTARTGENAIVHNMKYVDVVVGVIAIINANSMMGELESENGAMPSERAGR